MRKLIAVAATLLMVIGAVASGCGDDDDEGSAAGNGTDRAFAQAMIPHHESAVDMAEVARRRAEHPETRRLAGEIIRSQTAEIATLRRIDGTLAKDGVKPGDLGVPEHMTGMGGDTRKLETARPFDREFIAMMVPHHEGAIRMAKVELQKGKDAGLRRLAQAIIGAQEREIAQMRSWSRRWYGTAPAAPSAPAAPAGAEHGAGHG